MTLTVDVHTARLGRRAHGEYRTARNADGGNVYHAATLRA
jgi:hypothetical protein